MRLRISIFGKLLLFIVPLVCVPITLVGYFSIQASVERVNRLVRQEQMMQVEAAAKHLDAIFHNCRVDLETITRSPVLEDFHLARLFRLHVEAEFNRENLHKLFRDLRERAPHYYRLRFLDAQGAELVKAGQGAQSLEPEAREGFFQETLTLEPGQTHFSAPRLDAQRGGYLLHCARPFFTGWRELAGVAVIDLDFEKIIELVRGIQMGQEGYSFLVDKNGDAIAHHLHPPGHVGLHKADSPDLRQMILDMTAGKKGWDEYSFEGKRKVAAYAPVPAMEWSLAVAIPLEEFGAEAQAIRSRVLQLVAVTLVFALLGATVLSYNLLRPVRRLVAATNRLAAGDMDQEIPVRSGDELGELTRSFNQMVSNMSRIQQELVRSEKLISLGRLSAGVAHEIRNPLNAMRGAMAHMQQRWSQEPLIQQYTQLVCEEIDRLNRVVSDFLYFSKQAPPKLETVELGAVIKSVQRLMSEDAAAKGIAFVNELDPALPKLQVDPRQMGQVFLNLILNAMEAMPGGGEIRFITRLLPKGQGGQVQVVVADNGPGIAEEDLPSVLDPFFTTKDAGTGLGLPLSLGLVEGHGGSLDLDSRLGQGTRVVITLPLSRAGKGEGA